MLHKGLSKGKYELRHLTGDYKKNVKIGFFSGILKPELSMFSVKSAGIEGTVKSMEQKTRVFGQIDVQEFDLWTDTYDIIQYLVSPPILTTSCR